MKRDIHQEEVVRTILKTFHRFALVGMSGDVIRPSYFVGTYLAGHQFDFVSVNPKYAELFGRPCFKSLKDIRPVPEVVVVFRRAEDTPPVVTEAIALGARAVWLQFGIVSPESRLIAEKAGIPYVEDRCLKVEHARFYGNLHQTGFNTGIISSKKRHMSHSPVDVNQATSCTLPRK